MEKKNRDAYIDLIRGFACLSVLVYHVINGYMKDCANYPEMSYPACFEVIHSLMTLYHVPCFFCISGFLYQKYASKHFTAPMSFGKNYAAFIGKKALNLMIPYFVFSIFYILLSSFIQKDMHTAYGLKSILTLYRYPVAQYWYLLTLFLIFLAVPFLSRITGGRPWVLFAVSVLYNISKLFGQIDFGETQTYFVFFCLGFLWTDDRYKQWITKCFGVPATLLLLVLTVGGYAMAFRYTTTGAPAIAAQLIAALLLVNGVFLLGYHLTGTAMAGKVSLFSKYTLHVYLIHTWITGTIRVVLRHLNIYGLGWHILVGTVAGIIISLLISYVVKKIWWLNLFFEPVASYRAGKRAWHNDRSTKANN